MTIPELIRLPNLSADFAVDVAAQRLRVNIDGTTITRGVGGVLQALPPTLDVTTAELYEYRDIWAEESGALTANNAEWSYGNGAVGNMGLPFDSGWTVQAMYFNADVNAATADISIDLADMSTGVAVTVETIDVINSGSGGVNSAYQFTEYPAPVAVPAGAVLGFITRTLSEAMSDGRVGARLRRSVGTYVTAVALA